MNLQVPIDRCDCASEVGRKMCGAKECFRKRKNIRNKMYRIRDKEKREAPEQRACVKCATQIHPDRVKFGATTCGLLDCSKGRKRLWEQKSKQHKKLKRTPRACKFCNETIHLDRAQNAKTCGSKKCEKQKNKCHGCKLFQVSKKNNFFCRYCNPKKPVKVLRKEYHLLNYLQSMVEAGKIPQFIHNKALKVCSAFRPDFLFMLLSWGLILELNENQHKGYNTENEHNRMMTLAEEVGMPTVVIMFNPDTYRIKGKVQIQYPIELRYEVLMKRILYHLSMDIEARYESIKQIRISNNCYGGTNEELLRHVTLERLFYDDMILPP